MNGGKEEKPPRRDTLASQHPPVFTEMQRLKMECRVRTPGLRRRKQTCPQAELITTKLSASHNEVSPAEGKPALLDPSPCDEHMWVPREE